MRRTEFVVATMPWREATSVRIWVSAFSVFADERAYFWQIVGQAFPRKVLYTPQGINRSYWGQGDHTSRSHLHTSLCVDPLLVHTLRCIQNYLTPIRQMLEHKFVMSEHKHKPTEGIVLDSEGRDAGDRWVWCKTCNAPLGIKQALPFPAEPLPEFAKMFQRIA